MIVMIVSIGYLMSADGCTDDNRPRNTSAKDEQAKTELNQQGLNSTQPPPHITWSLERDNLIKRTLLKMTAP